MTITLHEYRCLIADNACLNRDIQRLLDEKKELENNFRAAISFIMLKAPEAIGELLSDLLASIGEKGVKETGETEAKN